MQAITGTLIEPAPAARPLVIALPPAGGGYVIGHPVAPAYLNGEVVEGAGPPKGVALAPSPGSEYEYTYVNNVPMPVEPTRGVSKTCIAEEERLT